LGAHREIIPCAMHGRRAPCKTGRTQAAAMEVNQSRDTDITVMIFHAPCFCQNLSNRLSGSCTSAGVFVLYIPCPFLSCLVCVPRRVQPRHRDEAPPSDRPVVAGAWMDEHQPDRPTWRPARCAAVDRMIPFPLTRERILISRMDGPALVSPIRPPRTRKYCTAGMDMDRLARLQAASDRSVRGAPPPGVRLRMAVPAKREP